MRLVKTGCRSKPRPEKGKSPSGRKAFVCCALDVVELDASSDFFMIKAMHEKMKRGQEVP